MASYILSEAEKVFVVHGAQSGIRNDGRNGSEIFPIMLELDAIKTADGSCIASTEGVDMHVGVKLELLSVQDPNALGDNIVNLSMNVMPKAAEIEGDLLEELTSCPFETLGVACKAALSNVRLPKVSRVLDGLGEDFELFSDNACDTDKLDVSRIPTFISACRCLVSPTLQELVCAVASVLVAVNASGQVQHLVKFGRGSLSLDSFRELLAACRLGAQTLAASTVLAAAPSSR